jgi:hypothetical protein
LPGDKAPEELLSEILHDPALLPEVSTELHRSEAHVKLALDHVGGMDHHELIPELARAMGADAYVVRHGLVRLWLSRRLNFAAAKDFVRDLNRSIDNIQRS